MKTSVLRSLLVIVSLASLAGCATTELTTGPTPGVVSGSLASPGGPRSSQPEERSTYRPVVVRERDREYTGVRPNSRAAGEHLSCARCRQ